MQKKQIVDNCLSLWNIQKCAFSREAA